MTAVSASMPIVVGAMSRPPDPSGAPGASSRMTIDAPSAWKRATMRDSDSAKMRSRSVTPTTASATSFTVRTSARYSC